jgi:murein DD-endopeptidase MepM/ murein hydrolase activator NlpD
MFIRPSEGRITSHFSPARKNPVHGRVQPHTGVDFGRDGSSAIKAAADGVITRARVMGGYGNCVTIKHVINGEPYETLYAHLKSFNIKVNDKVKAGQQIGVRGSSGNSTGEHLHFSIYTPYYKEGLEYAIDPLLYISDPAVIEVQQLLNKHGYKLIVDGIQGASTIKAIKEFQKKNGLVVDGSAGNATLAVLKKPMTAFSTVPIKPVSKGDEDELNFSSPTLQKETEKSIASKAHREIIVLAAVKAGANKSWLDKLKNNTLTDGDVFGLAIKYAVDSNK